MFVLFFLLLITENGLCKSTKKFVNIGASVTLTCPYRKENNTILWRSTTLNRISEDLEISPNLSKSKYEIVINKSLKTYDLTLHNVTKADERKYVCSTLKRGVVVEQTYHIQVSSTPRNLTVVNATDTNIVTCAENQTVTLSCFVSNGTPRGKLYWHHNDEILATRNDNSSWVHFTFTPKYEDNQKPYNCTVEHKALTTRLSESIILSVLYKPIVNISVKPHEKVMEHHNATLDCIVDSNPNITNITWTKDGNIISADYSYLVRNASKDDSGAYICQATNILGTGSVNISLTIEGKKDTGFPTSPVNPTVSKLPFIAIYLLVCCCVFVLLITSASGYSCWKSEKCSRSKRKQTGRINEGERQIEMNNMIQETEVSHYMEIDS